MLILALETTADVCSIAVRDGEGLLVERAFRHRMHLSERLIGDVDALLTDAGCTLANLDGLAVGIGPGSFTGVRIGVTTVKTWADTLAVPVIGVAAHDAIARAYAGHGAGPIVPLVRARPGSVYARVYGPDGRAEGEIEAVSVADVFERLAARQEARFLLCGDGLIKHAVELATRLGERAVIGRADAPRAALVAELAAERLAEGERDDPLALVPLYVSPPPIDPRAERKTA